ncbi:MAG TPA: hypothetical protein PKY84_09065, partial [Thermosynergistes sp.]|nr:hypothetical protein [Thermosynergistes sp.]
RFLCEFEDEEGFVEVVRLTSATKSHQKNSRVEVKKKECGGEVYVLVVSEERTVKDRSIREAHERRLLCDLKKLKERITCGRLVREDKVYEAIGRIKERYPRVAKYYEISYDEGKLTFTARKALKTHQVVTIVLPTADGRVLKVRRATRPTSEQIELYSKLNVPHEPIKPKKIWL